VVNGGLKEVLSSPEWCFLLDRHEPETLAEAVMHLLQDPAAARKVSGAGREHVRIISDPEAIAIEHEKLWKRGW
jgi:hypothetical protein